MFHVVAKQDLTYFYNKQNFIESGKLYLVVDKIRISGQEYYKIREKNILYNSFHFKLVESSIKPYDPNQQPIDDEDI